MSEPVQLSALPSVAFERIHKAAMRMDAAVAEALLASLRAELVEIESAVALVPQVIAGDRRAESSFRGLLEYAAGTDPASESEAPDSETDSQTRRLPPERTAAFAGADAFVDLSVAAAMIASDEADWETLSAQLLAMSDNAEWFEELAAAAADSELAEFQALATLFMRDRATSSS